ncbi:hypothetical protein QZH41_010461 [Actinostola sp. cb2023]|nr:hypothetical protein QZH41_010461 [Actinostola sp. cb2023]
MFVEVFVFVLALILLYFTLIKKGRPKGMPPGPSPLPIIGNLFDVARWTSKNQTQIEFTKVAQQYGDIFTFEVPGERTVVVNSASIAVEAMLTKKDDFAGKPYLFSWDYFLRGSKDIAAADFGPTMLMQRKIVHSAFRKYSPQLEVTIQREIEELSKRLKSYGGKPIDIEHDIYLTTTNVVCAIVYGKRYEIDDPEFLDIKDYNITSFRLLTIVNPLNTFPFLIHFPIKDSKDLDESRLKRDRLLDAKLHQHQATYQDGVIRDLTDALIKALQEAQEEDSKVKDLITEDHVVMTMQDTFSGGLESTMTSIRWFIIYMLHYPDIQAKIHEELDDVIGRDVMPGSEDKQRLHYLQASISEAMRVASVGSITMRKACVDSTLAGYKIPKGTTLLVNVWALHYDEKAWEQPHVFDPTRFLDDDGKFIPSILFYPTDHVVNMFVEVFVFVLALILLYFTLIKKGRPKGMPPGPSPLPIIGNLFDVVRWTSKNQTQIEFTKVAQQYGDIFTFEVPGERTVVVNSASIAVEAMLTKKDDFAGKPYLFSWDYFLRGSKDIAAADFGPTMLMQRKLVHSAFRKYSPQLEVTIQREIEELSKRLKSYGGKPIDIEHDIYLTTTNVVCAIVYGKRYEIDDPEFLDIKDYNITSFRLLSVVNLLNTFPFLIHFPIKDSKDLDESRLKRDRLLDAKLHQHQATYQDGVIRDLTDALIKALQEAQEEDSKVKDLITEDHVVMTMQDTFSGGLESTMTSIRWFIIYMLHYPDIQAKIHEELDDVIGRDVMPGSEDKQRLHYLQASISEAMRVASVGAITMRKACVDSTLAGYKIPKGTTLLVNVWALHYDEKAWEQPHVFDPTRFLDDDGKFIPRSASMSYLPFGAGRRVCVGEALAKQELFVVISRLMHQFKFESPPGCPLPELIGDLGVFHVPKPYKVCIKER